MPDGRVTPLPIFGRTSLFTDKEKRRTLKFSEPKTETGYSPEDSLVPQEKTESLYTTGFEWLVPPMTANL